jgi:hypothetical protein
MVDGLKIADLFPFVVAARVSLQAARGQPLLIRFEGKWTLDFRERSATY